MPQKRFHIPIRRSFVKPSFPFASAPMKFERKKKSQNGNSMVRLTKFQKIASLQENNNDGKKKSLVVGSSGYCYEILDLLGYGGFGTVHKASIYSGPDRPSEISSRKLADDIPDSLYAITADFVELKKKQFAIKTEKWESLKIEISVLCETRRCRHFCRLVDVGVETSTRISFMVMTLLGSSLSDMRHKAPSRRFTFSTVIRAAIQMLLAIQEIHECGFIQRDVKPSNFAVGLQSERQHRLIHLFDFGISKWFLDESRNQLPPRPSPGWRGTIRYCSINNHMKLDLSRRDDIESWFYTIVELMAGDLPWYFMDRDKKDEIEREKRQARTIKRQQFLEECPPEFDVILTTIDRWGFFTQPDYEGTCVYLMRAMKAGGAKYTDPYDWERFPSIMTAKRKEVVRANKKKNLMAGANTSGMPQSAFGPHVKNQINPPVNSPADFQQGLDIISFKKKNKEAMDGAPMYKPEALKSKMDNENLDKDEKGRLITTKYDGFEAKNGTDAYKDMNLFGTQNISTASEKSKCKSSTMRKMEAAGKNAAASSADAYRRIAGERCEEEKRIQ